MKFIVKKLGNIESGEVELGKLTIICGQNNTGKTYLSYAICGFINYALREAEFNIDKSTFEKLFETGFISLDISKFESFLSHSLKQLFIQYRNQIHTVFNTDEKFFSGCELSVIFDAIVPNFEREIKAGIGLRDKQVVRFYKAKNSPDLEVTLLSNKDKDADVLPEHIIQTILKQQIAQLYLGNLLKRPFAISSERTGVSLFYKDLDTNRNQIIEYITKTKKFDPLEMLSKITSSYALPIQQNIDYVRDFESLSKKKSFIFQNEEKYKLFIESWLLFMNGSFKVSNNQTVFIQTKSRAGIKPIPLHISSAALKSLFILDLYLRHFARVDDFLLIDEPELNLHPTNQIILARLLVQLVNMGLNIMITTHSDYILKEMNNLTLLSNEFNSKSSLMQKYNYQQEHILKPSDAKVYVINDKGMIENMKADANGIVLDIFDKTIVDLNQISDDIYYSMNP